MQITDGRYRSKRAKKVYSSSARIEQPTAETEGITNRSSVKRINKTNWVKDEKKIEVDYKNDNFCDLERKVDKFRYTIDTDTCELLAAERQDCKLEAIVGRRQFEFGRRLSVCASFVSWYFMVDRSGCEC